MQLDGPARDQVATHDRNYRVLPRRKETGPQLSREPFLLQTSLPRRSRILYVGDPHLKTVKAESGQKVDQLVGVALFRLPEPIADAVFPASELHRLARQLVWRVT